MAFFKCSVIEDPLGYCQNTALFQSDLSGSSINGIKLEPSVQSMEEFDGSGQTFEENQVTHMSFDMDEQLLHFWSDLKKRQSSGLDYGWENVNELHEMSRPHAGVSQAWHSEKQRGVSSNLK